MIHAGIVAYVGESAAPGPSGVRAAEGELSSKGIMMDNQLRAAALGLTLSVLGAASIGTASIAQATPMAGPLAEIEASHSPVWTLAQAKKKAAPARARTQRPRQQQQPPASQPGGGGGFLPG